MKLKYSLVFCDYDDTLTLPDGTVTPRTLSAIKAYRAAGGNFVVNTGRSYASVKKLLPRLYGEPEPKVPVICYQGGLTVGDNGEILRRVPMNGADIIRLAEEAENRGIMCQTYSGERMFISRMTDEARVYSSITDCSYDVVGDLPGFMKKYEGDFDKLLMIAPHERVVALKSEFAKRKEYPDFKFVFSRPTYLEAIPRESGKDSALRFLAVKLGIDISDVAAFGDSNNDTDMLRAAGFGIAVGNAREECKAAADFVCEPNTSDGLAKMLESFIV